MFSMIKFCIAFCFSFLLLSLPLNKKPLFFYLDDWAKPFTSRVFKHTQIVFLESVEDGKTFGKKIFNNSLPESESTSQKGDTIQTKSSALEKDIQNDNYTDEEKDMLSKILKGN